MEEKIFWIHIEGEGVKNKTARVLLLIKYLKYFNILFTKVAKFRNHISSNFPESQFQLYVINRIREGSFALGLKQNPDPYYIPLNMKDPHKEVIKDTKALLLNLSNGTYKFLKKNYPKIDNRLSLLETLNKLGPIKNNYLRITFNDLKEDFSKSELNVSFDEKLNKRINDWIKKEKRPEISSLSGKYIGFKDFKDKTKLWLKLPTGIEVACEFGKDKFRDEINSLNIYDTVTIFGDVLEVPGKTIKVKNVKKIEKGKIKPLLSIDELKSMFKKDEDSEFFKDLPLIRKILKKNHIVLYRLGEE
ncbi:MAG: hypothetical protein ACTSQP_15230 [Promethearchaeota archaeon]